MPLTTFVKQIESGCRTCEDMQDTMAPPSIFATELAKGLLPQNDCGSKGSAGSGTPDVTYGKSFLQFENNQLLTPTLEQAGMYKPKITFKLRGTTEYAENVATLQSALKVKKTPLPLVNPQLPFVQLYDNVKKVSKSAPLPGSNFEFMLEHLPTSQDPRFQQWQPGEARSKCILENLADWQTETFSPIWTTKWAERPAPGTPATNDRDTLKFTICNVPAALAAQSIMKSWMEDGLVDEFFFDKSHKKKKSKKKKKNVKKTLSGLINKGTIRDSRLRTQLWKTLGQSTYMALKKEVVDEGYKISEDCEKKTFTRVQMSSSSGWFIFGKSVKFLEEDTYNMLSFLQKASTPRSPLDDMLSSLQSASYLEGTIGVDGESFLMTMLQKKCDMNNEYGVLCLAIERFVQKLSDRKLRFVFDSNILNNQFKGRQYRWAPNLLRAVLFTLNKLGVDAEVVSCAESRLQELACTNEITYVSSNSPMAVHGAAENLKWIHLDSLIEGETITMTQTHSVNMVFDVLAWAQTVFDVLNFKTPAQPVPEDILRVKLATHVRQCVSRLFSHDFANAFASLNSAFEIFSHDGNLDAFRTLLEALDDEFLTLTRLLNRKYSDVIVRKRSNAGRDCDESEVTSRVLAPLRALMQKKKNEDLHGESTQLEQDLRELSEPKFTSQYLKKQLSEEDLMFLHADLMDEIEELVYHFYYSFRSEVIYGSNEIILTDVQSDLSARLRLIDTAETNRFVTEF